MAAMLRLPSWSGVDPIAAPDGACPVCCELPAGPAGYCSELCRDFDAALGELRDALAASGGDDPDGSRPDPRNADRRVAIARTALRTVARRFDAAHGLT